MKYSYFNFRLFDCIIIFCKLIHDYLFLFRFQKSCLINKIHFLILFEVHQEKFVLTINNNNNNKNKKHISVLEFYFSSRTFEIVREIVRWIEIMAPGNLITFDIGNVIEAFHSYLFYSYRSIEESFFYLLFYWFRSLRILEKKSL